MRKSTVRIALVVAGFLFVGLVALDLWRVRRRPLPHSGDTAEPDSRPAPAWPAPASTWSADLRAAAQGADRVVVRDQNFFGKGPQADCEVRGADKLEELFALIEIDPGRSGSACMCAGEFWLSVYRGDRELLTLGYHHNQALRWHHGRWKGDGALTRAAREALPAWFKKNGCAYLQDALDEERSRRKKEAEQRERFARCFPENVRGPLLESWPHAFAERARALMDTEFLIVCVCRALGSVEDPWGSATDSQQTAVVDALYDVTGTQFLAALKRMDNDPPGLRGAAQLFFFRKRFVQLVPLSARLEWLLRLTRVTLTEGFGEDKVRLLRSLARERDPAVKALLLDVFRSSLGKEIDQNEVVGEEPSLRACAALSLIQLGEEGIKEEVERLLARTTRRADVAALEVCLALLGNPKYLKAEHFHLNSFAIGYAGLHAIERHRSTRALQALVKGGIHHRWAAVNDSALETFARIVGERMSVGQVEDWWEVQHEGKGNRPEPLLCLRYAETQEPRCVAFSRDGRWVLAGGHDNTVAAWDARTGKQARTLRGHSSSVHDVALHPDGKHIATASTDRTVRIWDLGTAKEVSRLQGHQRWVLKVRYSLDGRRLLSASDSTSRLWDVGKDVMLYRLKNAGDVCFVFHPDGNDLAMGTSSGELQVRDAATGRLERKWHGHEGFVAGVDCSPDGRFLVSAGEDMMVRMWETGTGKPVWASKGHDNVVCHVVFRPGGKHVVSASWDKHVVVWEAATGKKVAAFKVHPESVSGLAVSPDGSRLATAGMDRTVRVWDLHKILKSAKTKSRP
jgi:hypothetical protein